MDILYVSNVITVLLWIGHYENGNSVVILRSRINSQYCDKVYYFPVSILYPIEENDTNGISIFIIVNKSKD